MEQVRVVDADSWEFDALEPSGADAKEWLRVPGGGWALFKPNRPHDRPDEQGEDWAEKLVGELAGHLGVPSARIDLAHRGGGRGCLSYDVRPARGQLQPGAVLVAALPGVDHDPRGRDAIGHSLPNIAAVLSGYGVPESFAGPDSIGAFGVFAGYLVLDALVCNRDRHSENWAVVVDNAGGARLAPSFDHASSLAFNMLDVERQQRLRDPRAMAAFLRKGTAYRFEGGRKVSLVDHARAALDLAGPTARAFWLGRLAAVDVEEVERIVEGTGNMSPLARRMAKTLIVKNLERLLDD